jgi:ribonucleoside-diphosphate reductase alpha chain
MDHIKIATEIMSRGGGVGSCISSLRPRNAIVKGVNGFSSGSVSWANYLSQLTHLISQAGTRRGAQIIGLHVWHPDVLEFIMCKIQNPDLLDLLSRHHNPRIAQIAEMYLTRDESGKPIDVVDKQFMTGANISVLITDDFMEKVKSGGMWELKYPDLENLSEEQKEIYDKEWERMPGLIKEWEKRRLPVKVYGIIPARDLWDLITTCARYSAEPGVIFIDRYNKEANSYYYTNIDISNPCGR